MKKCRLIETWRYHPGNEGWTVLKILSVKWRKMRFCAFPALFLFTHLHVKWCASWSWKSLSKYQEQLYFHKPFINCIFELSSFVAFYEKMCVFQTKPWFGLYVLEARYSWILKQYSLIWTALMSPVKPWIWTWGPRYNFKHISGVLLAWNKSRGRRMHSVVWF